MTSGDVAFSGKYEEYKIAAKIYDSLIEKLEQYLNKNIRFICARKP